MFKATRGKNPVDLLQKFEDWLPENGVGCMQCAVVAVLLIDLSRNTIIRLCTSTIRNSYIILCACPLYKMSGLVESFREGPTPHTQTDDMNITFYALAPLLSALQLDETTLEVHHEHSCLLFHHSSLSIFGHSGRIWRNFRASISEVLYRGHATMASLSFDTLSREHLFLIERIAGAPTGWIASG